MKRMFELYAVLFARPSLYRFHRLLFQLALRGMGVLNWTSERVRGERALLQRLFAHRSLGGVALDVGANIGEYAKMLVSLSPQLQVHAFEPHPKTFANLQDSVEALGVHCHNLAIGCEAGRSRLFDYAETDGSSHASLFEAVIEQVHRRPSVQHEIDVVRLDTFLAEHSISKVLLLKIDVEGAELNVLRGLSDFFSDERNSIEFIQMEFNEMNVVSRAFFRDFLEVLRGYRAYRILPYGRLIEITDYRPAFNELFAYQNILFSRFPIQD